MVAKRRTALEDLLGLPDPERRVGAYQLLEALGKGTFAPVWRARRVYGTTFVDTAAVKLFSLDAGGEGLRERIEREVEALRSSHHPNVVKVLGLEEDQERRIIGLAMEHVDGTPLHKQLRPGKEIRPLPVDVVIAIGVAVSSALSAVHQAGLIHRDVKPPNIVRSHVGVYKLIDFGIASPQEGRDSALLEKPSRPAGASDPETEDVEMIDDVGWSLQVETVVVPTVPAVPISTVSLTSSEGEVGDARDGDGTPGTPGYKDPHCLGPTWGDATYASDLYGLGATLFECLSGAVPALAGRAGYDADVLSGRSPPPSLLSQVPEAPPDLGRLIDRLLDPDPVRRPRSASAVVEELLRIQDALRGRKRTLPPAARGPFRGLDRFEQDDCDVFFGRDPEIAAALGGVGRAGLTAIVGPSGSGKSSLTRAGVLPRVMRGALGEWPAEWISAIASPGTDPFGNLAAALADVLPGGGESNADAIVTALAERAYATGQGLVMVIDQFEEMITLTTSASPPKQLESRTRAVELLERLSEQAPVGLRAIVVGRLDFLGELLALGRGLAVALTRNLVLVSPMVEAQLEDVLQEALAAYGYDFEDAVLRDEVVAQVRELDADSAMPLVQFALEHLWQKRDPDKRRITRAAFKETGGIPGMLDRYADQVLGEIEADRPKGWNDARQVLTALTTVQGTRTTRSVAELTAEAAGAAGVVSALEKARLVVREGDGYELAHEALLTHWGRLRSWVGAARAHRRLKEELEADAKRWEEKHDPALLKLWTGTRLQEAIELRGTDGVRLSGGVTGFVEAAKRRAERWKVTVVVAVALVLVAGVLMLLRERRLRQREEALTSAATKEKDKAEAQERVAQGEKTSADAARAAADAARAAADAARTAAEKAKDDLEKAVGATTTCKDELAKARAPRPDPWARPPGVQ